MELIRRLRHSGYLGAHEITESDQFEILEQLVEKLSGGPGRAKLYYVVDRRDFMEKVISWCQSQQKLLASEEYGEMFASNNDAPAELFQKDTVVHPPAVASALGEMLSSR